MAIRIPPFLPSRPGPFGGKPLLEYCTYVLAGRVETYEGRPIEWVRIAFIDKLTNTETAHTYSDANGMFQQTVRVNSDGYRVDPYRYEYSMSPAFFDAIDSMDCIRFRAKYMGKGESKGEPDPK